MDPQHCSVVQYVTYPCDRSSLLQGGANVPLRHTWPSLPGGPAAGAEAGPGGSEEARLDILQRPREARLDDILHRPQICYCRRWKQLAIFYQGMFTALDVLLY